MKNIAFALLLGSSALVAVPALAQSNDATTAPASSMSAAGGDFVTARQPDQFLASNIRGANVMGAQNDNIGTVSDMIVDKDGKLAAVTVDVGGFLGIGAKTVALPVAALEFVPVSAAANSNMASNNAMAPAGTAMAPAGTAAPAAGTAATNGADPAVTGSTAPDSTATTSPTGGMAGGTAGNTSMQTADNTAAAGTTAAGSDGTRLDHIKVNFTRDQLQNAPEFND